MCRIAGFWDLNYKGDYDLEEVIRNMRDTLIHGGPDDAGFYIDKNNCLALGHRRLAIVDPSPLAHQPMSTDDGNLWITYDGEVYNFREIRAELEKENFQFISDSDAEVVLKAYEKWGIEAIKKFRGIFAFAIWDRKREALILVRDRIEVKPLYYYYKNGLFMFSSELKAFHQHPNFEKEIDEIALLLYLRYGYIPSPYAIFKNTQKVEPGSVLLINSKGEIYSEKYWEIEKYFIKGVYEKEKWLRRSEEELAEELEEILTESLKLHLLGNDPVGVFLSGGIDSSLICALLKKVGAKVKTFTIGFYEDGYNEANFAKKVANYLGTDHTEQYCTANNALEIIPRLPQLYDEPYSNTSALPTILISQLAKSRVKAALIGEGADVEFCGNIKYWIIGNFIQELSRLPFILLFGKLINLVHPDLAEKLYNKFKFLLPKYSNFKDKFLKLRKVLMSNELLSQYELAMRYFLDEDLNLLLGERLPHMPPLMNVAPSLRQKMDAVSQLLLIDFKTYLPGDLIKVDRAATGESLDYRVPFLDHRIIEWTSQLPVEFKYRKGIGKLLLRRVVYRYIPSEFFERPKQGFGTPVPEWFRGNLKEVCFEYLSKHRIEKGGLFNASYVEKLIYDYFTGKSSDSDKLWLLLMFELWREKWKV